MKIYDNLVALAFVVMVLLGAYALFRWIFPKPITFSRKDAPELFDADGKLKMEP